MTWRATFCRLVLKLEKAAVRSEGTVSAVILGAEGLGEVYVGGSHYSVKEQ